MTPDRRSEGPLPSLLRSGGVVEGESGRRGGRWKGPPPENAPIPKSGDAKRPAGAISGNGRAVFELATSDNLSYLVRTSNGFPPDPHAHTDGPNAPPPPCATARRGRVGTGAIGSGGGAHEADAD